MCFASPSTSSTSLPLTAWLTAHHLRLALEDVRKPSSPPSVLPVPLQVCSLVHMCTPPSALASESRPKCGSTRSSAMQQVTPTQQQQAGQGLSRVVGRVWERAEWALGMLRLRREAGAQQEAATAAQ
jgi:hypothetical protein